MDRPDHDAALGPNAPVPQVTPSIMFPVRDVMQRYSGPGQIARLLFAAPRLHADRAWCYERAITLLKNTRNTQLYRRAFELAAADSTLVAHLPPLDASWADAQDKKATAELEELEAELNSYKQNLIRKKIRTSHNSIGAFYEARGDFNAALRSYIRTQDYCTSPDQILEMCMHVIEVSLHLGNFAHVLNYIGKAEQTPGVTDKRSTIALLKAVGGLAQLENRKYKQAARKFLEISWEAHSQQPLLLGGLITPQDIAVYGALCSLAEFSRSELKQEVLDNASFKNFLALVPQVSQMITDFAESKYASCLTTLELLKNDLQLDVHLHDHIGTLYEKIRSKALVQYFSPYVAVDLNKMSSAFQTGLYDLEKELAKLIADGVIAARIDSHNKRLVAKHADERASTFQSTISVGQDFQVASRALLLRVNLVRANFVVKPGNKSGQSMIGASKDRKGAVGVGKADKRK